MSKKAQRFDPMTAPVAELASTLRTVRLELGWSFGVLGRHVGVAPNAIRDFIEATRNPHETTAYKVRRFLASDPLAGLQDKAS